MLRLVMRDGETFEGQTHLDLVRAMKGATMFGEAKGALEYVALVQRRAREIEKVELAVVGERIDDRCESFVGELERAKLAALEQCPDKGLSPLSRLVQLCADIRFGGDVVSAWPEVRQRMGFTQAERQLVERELELVKMKPQEAR